MKVGVHWDATVIARGEELSVMLTNVQPTATRRWDERVETDSGA
jgi:hypothetical protein